MADITRQALQIALARAGGLKAEGQQKLAEIMESTKHSDLTMDATIMEMTIDKIMREEE